MSKLSSVRLVYIKLDSVERKRTEDISRHKKTYHVADGRRHVLQRTLREDASAGPDGNELVLAVHLEARNGAHVIGNGSRATDLVILRSVRSEVQHFDVLRK